MTRGRRTPRRRIEASIAAVGLRSSSLVRTLSGLTIRFDSGTVIVVI
jgi:hypothetical protein